MIASAWGASEDEKSGQGGLRKVSPPLSLGILLVGKGPVTDIMSVLDPFPKLEAGIVQVVMKI